MSALTNRLKSAPKPLRVIVLMLLVVLLVLLITYAVLEYVAPNRAPAPVPTTSAAVSPTVDATKSALLPTVTPRPTQTAVLKKSPTVETAEEDTGDMEALDEPAGPLSTPRPAPTIALDVDIRSLPSGRSGNVLANAEFNQGFQENGLALGWSNFNNSSAVFSYRPDDWPWVKEEEGQTQIIRIKDAELPDRYVGIYQTASVIPGKVYTFTISGLTRTNAGDVKHTDFGYRMEIGFDPSGGHNWKAVDEWIELPWDEQLRQQNEYRFDRYTTTVTADSGKLTVFIRAWKKWADAGEGAYDIDSVNLTGPTLASGGDVAALSMPVTGKEPASLAIDARSLITFALLLMLLFGTMWRVARRRP